MTMTIGNLKNILSNKEDHGLTKDLVKQLPKALADPIMVFESATISDSLVALTGLKQDGRSILVAIHLDRIDQRMHVNDFASVYKRKQGSWYINQIENGKLIIDNPFVPLGI